ncbi:MAG: hypothetical protein ACI86M_002820 [Saprospiraceae bacterium]|jgi:hypothetical protein
MTLRKFIITSSLVLFSSLGWSQSDMDVVTIETSDKQYYRGELFRITSDSIFIYGNESQVKGFAKSNIMNLYKGVSLNSEIQNVSEPFYVSTARNNGKGNNYYKNYFLFGNNFSYGVRDNLDLTFGFEFISLINENGTLLPVIQLGVNYGSSISESVSVGLSTKIMFNEQGGLIFASVPVTFGGERSNFTFAPTLGLVTEVDNPLLIPMVNWNMALGKKTRLVTDAMLLEKYLVGTSMIEYTFNNGYSMLVGILFSEEIILPNFSFVIPFGKWKNRT